MKATNFGFLKSKGSGQGMMPKITGGRTTVVRYTIYFSVIKLSVKSIIFNINFNCQ